MGDCEIPSAEEQSESLWLGEVMETHATLAKSISRSVIVAAALSAFLIGLMLIVTSAYGNRQLTLTGMLVGLWLGAFIAGAFRTVLRPPGDDGSGFPEVLTPPAGLSFDWDWDHPSCWCVMLCDGASWPISSLRNDSMRRSEIIWIATRRT